ncbi:hypothetical protein Ancab_039449, partial [Ancistrocladus abbreviatus]
RKKVVCSLGPRKPKRDGVKKSSLQKPNKCRPFHQRMPIPPVVNNGDKLSEHDVPNDEA